MISVLYAGSPQESALTLKTLFEKSNSSDSVFKIAGVLTNLPSAQGRHKTPVPTPVASFALEHGIPVFEPEHLDSSARESVSKINADLLVCFAYGHIFGPKFLSLFKYGGINLHPSALPKYRGCTPVNAAILNQDKTTAFTVQTLSLKMDEGEILCQKEVNLLGTETAGSLLQDAALFGAELIFNLLLEIEKGGKIPQGKVQTGEPSYTGIILKQDALINWNKDSKEIDAFVRAYSPEPCAWTKENGNTLKIINGKALLDSEIEELSSLLPILKEKEIPGKVLGFSKQKGILVSCKNGIYAITELQRQGKKPMDYKSFMNGVRDFVGTVFEL